MSDSNTVMDQDINVTSIGGSTYVTIDGRVKYCITAPLLELPVNFMEWHQPTRSNATQLYQI